jgi:purine-binding chemotaxis protein CheW
VSDLHVLFNVGDASYVLPASAVLQMETFSGATRVPGTSDFVAGLVQVRGAVIPVVDVRIRFGLPAHAPVLDSRIIVLAHGDRKVGLLVDSAREVVNIPAAAFQAPPEVVAERSARFVKSVARAGDRLVMLIDVDRVIGEEKLHGE